MSFDELFDEILRRHLGQLQAVFFHFHEPTRHHNLTIMFGLSVTTVSLLCSRMLKKFGES